MGERRIAEEGRGGYHDLNVVTLSGRLAAEPQYWPGGEDKRPYLRFPLAVNRRWRDTVIHVDCIYVYCSIFGGYAETLANILKEGAHVIVTGSLDITTFPAPNGEGKNRYTSVIVREVCLIKTPPGRIIEHKEKDRGKEKILEQLIQLLTKKEETY